MQWAENFAYRHADRLISMLPNAEPHMREHGLEAKRFLYVPNGIDVENWIEAPEQVDTPHRKIIEEAKSRRRFLVAYTGSAWGR